MSMSLTYTPKNRSLRETEEIIGDENRAVNLQRASIPREEVKDFFAWFSHEMDKIALFGTQGASVLSGIGSTRQYLEEDFAKPYAGDLDLIVQLPVLQKDIQTHVKERIAPKLHELGVRTDASFGNISLFIPLMQHISSEPLYIQVDLMFAPQEREIYDFLKNTRYYSAEPYQLIEGKYYLKGVHTALLLEQMLVTKGYLMDNIGIYTPQYREVTESTIAQMQQILQQKTATQRMTPKLKSHLDKVGQRAQTKFPLSGKSVFTETSRDILPNKGVLYTEIADCLIIDLYVADAQQFLVEKFGRTNIHTFAEGVALLAEQYVHGQFSEAEIQSLRTQYVERLQRKHKGVLWFPQLQAMIQETFPFVQFPQ